MRIIQVKYLVAHISQLARFHVVPRLPSIRSLAVRLLPQTCSQGHSEREAFEV